MNNPNITSWILDAFPDNKEEVAVMTIRADGTIPNGSGRRQSPWSKSATGSLHLLIEALDRTVSQLSRGDNKDLKFVAFLGGETAKDVSGHFHALIQYPSKADKAKFIEDFKHLWSVKASNALKAQVKTSVFVEPIKSRAAFADYCQRCEGTTFGRGSDKVVMSRSFRL